MRRVLLVLGLSFLPIASSAVTIPPHALVNFEVGAWADVGNGPVGKIGEASGADFFAGSSFSPIADRSSLSYLGFNVSAQ